MPKQKTHSGSKKRFKVTGSGKIMKQQAGMRHNLEVKASKRKAPPEPGPGAGSGRRQGHQEASRPLSRRTHVRKTEKWQE